MRTLCRSLEFALLIFRRNISISFRSVNSHPRINLKISIGVWLGELALKNNRNFLKSIKLQ